MTYIATGRHVLFFGQNRKDGKKERRRNLPITPHNPHFIIDTKIFAITTPYIRPNRPITLFS